MSEFVDNIVGQLLPQRKRVYEKLDVKQIVECLEPLSYKENTLHAYNIEVRYGVVGHVYPNDYQYFLENVKKELLLIIYGDLLKDMHKLHEALYQHDYEKSVKILNDMRDEIYGTKKAKASTHI